MEKKEEIALLSPIEAYNKACHDCADTADIKVVGDPKIMSFNNCSPRDIQFFDVDKETILKNLIPAT